MTPLALFLLGCVTVFLGVVQAAFSALMRLSLRLMAERGGRDDRLGYYLDDPLQLRRKFVRNEDQPQLIGRDVVREPLPEGVEVNFRPQFLRENVNRVRATYR